ncbi:DUF6541 family protein [Arthrobacter sp. TMP15]|uniref:DUF6541 family protein n=1 Tax=Arthrobacter sp. TMP15 TaxID=3140789 RepID=UPI0031BA30C2
MTWFDTLPTLLAAAALIFLPGAILARILGARGITWLAVSAPLSMTLVGVGAIVAQLAHVRWTPVIFLVLSLLTSAGSWLIRYFMEIRQRQSRAPLWVRSPNATIAGLIGGLSMAAGILSWRLSRAFISPENISQTYDNVFHLNAVRFIIDTGNGSSLHLASLDPSGTGSFYPAVWHDLVALVSQLSGASIPVSLNATNMLLAAVVWTISAMFLSSRVLGSRPAVYLATGALAGAFSAFPYLLLEFGVLYPNFLAITLFPVTIGLVADVLRVSKHSHHGWIRSSILLLAILPGVALSHPSIAIVLGAFVLPVLGYWLYKRFRAYRDGELPFIWFLTAISGLIIYIVALQYVWERFRPSEKASFWPPRQTIAQALGEGFINAPMGSPISWVLVALTLLGVYGMLRGNQDIWLIGLLAVGIALFVVVSGFAKGDFRSSITGVFYNDSYRLAALLPVAGIAVTVYGSVWIFDLLCSKLQDPPLHGRTRPWLAAMTAGTIGVVGLSLVTQDNSVDNAVSKARSSYNITANARLLSTDEAALIERADRTIPTGATVIVNPSTGASLVYALEDRRVLLPAVSSTPSPEVSVLINHLSDLKKNPEVCAAVRNLDSYYILDFGNKQINNMKKPFPTSEELAATPGLTLIDQEGPAKLYRIDGC